MQFQTISFLYQESGFLLTRAEQNWAGVLEVESEQQAWSNDYCQSPPIFTYLPAACCFEVRWVGMEIRMLLEHDYPNLSILVFCLVVLAACQMVQRQRRTKQQDWDLSLVISLISVFGKSIFFGTAPKITSPCKEEKWVSQHIPSTVSILRTRKYQYSTVSCDSSYWMSKNRKY